MLQIQRLHLCHYSQLSDLMATLTGSLETRLKQDVEDASLKEENVRSDFPVTHDLSVDLVITEQSKTNN